MLPGKNPSSALARHGPSDMSLESVVLRFEQLWLGGQRPSLDDFLPPAGEPRARVLPELIHVELELRLKAGEAARVEEYLERFPELAQQPTVVRELVAAEYRLRRRREPTLSLEQYRERFPQSADWLAQLGAERRNGAGRPPEDLPWAVTRGAPSPTAVRVETIWPDVPGYEVQGELGRGGMGVVYRARDVTLNRAVALKVVLAGGHTGAAERTRFLAEARAVAHLQHPNIVQLFECGEHGGLPFLTLELVPGGSLAERLAGAALPPREAARLVEQLARAVAYAHGRGVLHRDLKPANVLLAADGTPKITDFGLAKRLDDEAVRTASGAILGTPCYMAPEQTFGDSRWVGPAADVYALGAILYELLTGRPPFKAATTLETLDQVRRREPVSPRRLNPAVPRDLATVCLTCLYKEPAKRYAGAGALADDLQRWLTGRPVLARPVRWPGRVARWAKRNPAVAALGGAVFLSLLVGTVLATAFAVEAGDRADEAQRHAAAARLLADKARKAEERANREAQEADKNARLAREGEDSAYRHLYVAQLFWAQREVHSGSVARASDLLARLVPEAARKDLRGLEWYHLRNLCHPELRTLIANERPVYGVCFSPDGQHLASAGHDNLVHIWDRQTGRQVRSLAGHSAGIVCVAYSPDGTLLASSGDDLAVRLWDARTGKEGLPLRGHTGGCIHSVAFSPDGKRLASASSDQTVRVWDVRTGKPLHVLRAPGGPIGVAFSPDGGRLATSAYDGLVTVWDTATGKECFRCNANNGQVSSVAFSPDGRHLAHSGMDGTVRLRHAGTGEPRLSIRAHDQIVYSVAFSADGKRLASCSADQTIKVWDPETGKALLRLCGHTSPVFRAVFSPDGRWLASASTDAVKIWDAGRPPATVTLPSAHGVAFDVALSPDGKRLAVAHEWGGTVTLWDVPSRKPLRALRGHADRVRGVAFSPSGKLLGSCSADKMIKLWDMSRGEELLCLEGHRAGVCKVSFSPDGLRLASAGEDRTVRIWDTRTGKALLTLQGHKGPVYDVAYSPDGGWVASASGDGTVRLWEAATGKEYRTLPGHTAEAIAVRFRPGGKQLTSGGSDRTVRVWEVSTGRLLRILHAPIRGLQGAVFGVAYSPDGKRLAAANENGTISLWEPDLAQELTQLEGHGGSVYRIHFSPDGKSLVSASHDATVRLWGELAAR